ncbi:hypothetical protein GF378_00150 [Candidatus Pacearchaeota archaeon]|nr:hypothetical protein [Candidatus Pacearchaeota archaeon]
MARKNKLIKDVDEDTWRKFIAYCKLKNIRVGKELSEVLDKFLKNKLKRMLK